MPNYVKKTDIQSIKPGGSGTFQPTFEVVKVEGREKQGSDYVYAWLGPRGGGAADVGTITLRMPAVLAAGSSLEAFAILTGQDPAKGFSVAEAIGARVRLTLSTVNQE